MPIQQGNSVSQLLSLLTEVSAPSVDFVVKATLAANHTGLNETEPV